VTLADAEERDAPRLRRWLRSRDFRSCFFLPSAAYVEYRLKQAGLHRVYKANCT
jgi:hypothetical protein